MAARLRKQKNLRSAFDKPVNDENRPITGEKFKEYNPAKRKFEMISSGVFEEKPVKEFDKIFRNKICDEKRRKCHLYTDLGNQEYEYPEKKLKDKNFLSLSQSFLSHSSKTNNVF